MIKLILMLMFGCAVVFLIPGNVYVSPAQEIVKGKGIKQKKAVQFDSADTALQAVSTSVQRLPLVIRRSQTNARVVDIALDRQSFLDRGWNDSDLGRYNGGAASERRGLFLSMYYALQAGNPNDSNHPWSINVHPWRRGIGAHIDYYLKEQFSSYLRFWLYAYDSSVAPTKKGIIVGRRSSEPPFNSGACKDAIGCAGADDNIYIRTDFNWILGGRLDEPCSIKVGGLYYYNITYIISHEAGHFFGLPHVEDPHAIMFSRLCETDPQMWHSNTLELQVLFRQLAVQFFH